MNTNNLQRKLNECESKQISAYFKRLYAKIEQLHYYEIDVTFISEMHSIAFIIVDEIDMKTYRDALKPHRGELAI